KRKNIAGIVLDDQNAAVFKQRLTIAGCLKHPLPLDGHLGFDLVEKEGHLIEKTFRRACVLDNNGFGESPQSLLLVARERSAGIHNYRWKGHIALRRHFFQQLVAAEVRQIQIHHYAIERQTAELCQRLAGSFHPDDSNSSE